MRFIELLHSRLLVFISASLKTCTCDVFCNAECFEQFIEPETACRFSEQGRGGRADFLLCFDIFVCDLRGSDFRAVAVAATTQ